MSCLYIYTHIYVIFIYIFIYIIYIYVKSGKFYRERPSSHEMVRKGKQNKEGSEPQAEKYN